MPGRAGRSKGCINCQRRKVGCDQAKPSCGRCVRLNEACEGYSSASFIAFKGPKAKAVLASKACDIVDSKRPWIVMSRNLCPMQPVTRLSLSIAPTPSMTVMNKDIFINYTKQFMLKGTNDHFPVFDLIDAAMPSNTLYSASITALATSYFGLTQGRHDILQKGTKLYGKALQDVNHTLAAKASVASADLLSSIVCLGMFEFIHPTSIDGWRFHFNGLSRLFEMWGPEACSNQPIKQFFGHCRPVMIFASMKDGQPSFLSRPEWKSIPWSRQDSPRVLIDFLFDIMADLPSYSHRQEQLDLMSKDDARKESMIADHMGQIRSSLAELDDWLTSFAKSHGEYRSKVPSPTAPANSVGQQLAWQSIYHYKSLDIANCICFHDATRIYLLRLLIGNFSSCSPCAGSTESNPSVYVEAMRKSALDICRSAEFHLMHYQDAAGGFFLLFPMIMSMKAFIKLEMWPEVKWTQDQFIIIENRNKVVWRVASHYR